MTNTNSNTNECPKCGAALSEDAPRGLCPKCLMDQVLADDTLLPSDAETKLRAPSRVADSESDDKRSDFQESASIGGIVLRRWRPWERFGIACCVLMGVTQLAALDALMGVTQLAAQDAARSETLLFLGRAYFILSLLSLGAFPLIVRRAAGRLTIIGQVAIVMGWVGQWYLFRYVKSGFTLVSTSFHTAIPTFLTARDRSLT